MSELGSGRIDRVSHVELRDHLSEVVRSVRDGRRVAVTNHNRIEVYIVAESELASLSDAAAERDRIRSVVPLLLAAVKSGVAFPSEALRSLIGSELLIDWSAMNAFQAAFPIEVTHDDQGQPLPDGLGGFLHTPIEELDDELRYI